MDHPGDQRLADEVLVDVDDQPAIELDELRTQLRDVAERGEPGTGVVDRELDVVAERRDRGPDLAVIVNRDVLRDLEHDVEATLAQVGPQRLLGEDHLRADVQVDEAVGRQRLGGVERGGDRGRLELDAHPARGGVGEHPVGRRAVGEAAERLVPEDGRGLEIDDRLEHRPERAALDRPADPVAQLLALVPGGERRSDQRGRMGRELAEGVEPLAQVRLGPDRAGQEQPDDLAAGLDRDERHLAQADAGEPPIARLGSAGLDVLDPRAVERAAAQLGREAPGERCSGRQAAATRPVGDDRGALAVVQLEHGRVRQLVAAGDLDADRIGGLLEGTTGFEPAQLVEDVGAILLPGRQPGRRLARDAPRGHVLEGTFVAGDLTRRIELRTNVIADPDGLPVGPPEVDLADLRPVLLERTGQRAALRCRAGHQTRGVHPDQIRPVLVAEQPGERAVDLGQAAHPVRLEDPERDTLDEAGHPVRELLATPHETPREEHEDRSAHQPAEHDVERHLAGRAGAGDGRGAPDDGDRDDHHRCEDEQRTAAKMGQDEHETDDRERDRQRRVLVDERDCNGQRDDRPRNEDGRFALVAPGG